MERSGEEDDGQRRCGGQGRERFGPGRRLEMVASSKLRSCLVRVKMGLPHFNPVLPLLGIKLARISRTRANEINL